MGDGAKAPAWLARLSDHVAPQVEELLRGTSTTSVCGRHIHDPVWGTIWFHGHEVAVLDTPLAQRLRRIKQLGSTHMVFPGAVHTRFEHTLGVVHQTARMCGALRKANADAVADGEVVNMRMAALCHDLGHGPFSHLSEEYFKDLDPMPDILEQAHGPGAAELVSAAIVASAPMRDFLAKVSAECSADLDADFIAAAIIGSLPPDRSYLGEIVHGPFDADKLDYLTRDGMNCGVPVQIDTDRIYSSMAITKPAGDSRRRLAGHRRAAAALLQVVNHKHHMYATVYDHDVSRAFGVMLTKALRYAVEDRTQVGGGQLGSPADFLALDDEMLTAPATVAAPSRAASIISDIRNRRIFKVAFETRPASRRHARLAELATGSAGFEDMIAKAAGIGAEEVGVSLARSVSNNESWAMPIEDGDVSLTLGSLLGRDGDGTPLQGILERHLIVCARRHKDAVSKAAVKILG